MKTIGTFTAILLVFSSFFMVYGQGEKRKIYKVWVEFNDDRENVKGKLIRMNDSTLVMQYWKEEKEEEINIQEIYRLKFRKNRAIGKGVGLGVGIGVLAGVIAGLAEGDDEPGFIALSAEQKAGGYGVGLAPIGAGIGAAIGSLKKKYEINGDQETYERLKPELSKYVSN